MNRKYSNWKGTGSKGVVGLIYRSPRQNVDILSFWCIYFLFRNNCFGLSVEDSLDCCRQCMMIRQTKTNQLSRLLSIAVVIIHRNCVLND